MMPYTLMNTGMVKGMVGGGAGRAELKMGEGRGLLFLLWYFTHYSDAKPDIHTTQRVFVVPLVIISKC